MPEVSRILVVDDDELNLFLIRNLLEREGYELYTFTSPLLALKQIKELRPGLVLTDLVMPHMDGLELTRKIKEVFPVPVILLSASDEGDNIEDKAREQGVHAFLPKPVDANRLRCLVSGALVKMD
jgi:CheY-like chemotaxis protein